jgi:hypothetical protein
LFVPPDLAYVASHSILVRRYNDLIKEDEMSLKDYGDDSIEKGRVQIAVDPVQNRSAFRVSNQRPQKLNIRNSSYFHHFEDQCLRGQCPEVPQKYG